MKRDLVFGRITLPEDPRRMVARLSRRCAESLPMWTVYRPTTSDYPGFWIARLHLALPTPRPSRFVILEEGLESLRLMMPPGFSRLARSPGDDAVIEEVWL